MDEKDKHIRSYTTLDIRRYLDGELSSAEMYALEKAAMDDPFLADAISGMEWNDREGSVPFETGMAELNKRLLEKTAEADKKKKWLLPLLFRWQAAAAVLLLLLGSCYLGYLLLIKHAATPREVSVIPHKKKDTVIQNISPIPQPIAQDTIYAPVGKNSKQRAVTREGTGNAVAKQEEEKKPGTGNAEMAAPAPVTTAAAMAKKEDEIKVIESPVTDTEKDNAGKTVKTELSGRVAGIDIQKARRKGPGIHPAAYLEGFVMDSSGQPVAAATVRLQEDNAATVTDKKGYFKLGTQSLDSNQDVAVTAPGYQPASSTVTLSRPRNNNIRLPYAENQLNEVVVTAYGLKKEKRLRKNNVSDTVRAIPAPAAWYDYFNNHKKIPTTDSSLHGVETVSFLVHKNGKLSGFRVEQSLSPVHDAETIRLIRTGPPWKPIKGKKQRVRVTVTF